MGSIIRVSGINDAQPSRLLFSNPQNKHIQKTWQRFVSKKKWRMRRRGVLSVSYDEGKTWPIKKVMIPGPFAYSDLSMDMQKWIYCLFEGSPNSKQRCEYDYINCIRFNWEWVTDGKDTLD